MTMTVLKPVTITDALFSTSTVPETDYTAWSSATTYAVGNRCIKSHKIYESLQAANLNHDPTTDTSQPPFWIEVSSTNRWKMFDQQVNSQTTAASSIVVELFPGAIDSIGFVELTGSTVNVKLYDGAVLIYEATQNIDATPIYDWYDYFYEPADVASALIFTGVPRYLTGKIVITVAGTGTVGCGGCFLGTNYELGVAQYGASAGIVDYSRKTTNSFGITTVSVGAFSKRASLRLLLDNIKLRQVQALLADLRATFCLWSGVSEDDTFSPLTIYGYWRDFSLEIAYPTQSYCSLEIEGVI